MQFIQKDKTSKAMKAYLERAQEHDIFMKSQQQEFEIGKRHLANMMGENPDTFTNQEDIDVIFTYLVLLLHNIKQLFFIIITECN